MSDNQQRIGFAIDGCYEVTVDECGDLYCLAQKAGEPAITRKELESLYAAAQKARAMPKVADLPEWFSNQFTERSAWNRKDWELIAKAAEERSRRTQLPCVIECLETDGDGDVVDRQMWSQLVKAAQDRCKAIGKEPKHSKKGGGEFQLAVIMPGDRFTMGLEYDLSEYDEPEPGDVFVGCQHIPYSILVLAVKASRKMVRK